MEFAIEMSLLCKVLIEKNYWVKVQLTKLILERLYILTVSYMSTKEKPSDK